MRIAVWINLPSGGAKRAAFELGGFLAARHDLDLYRLSTTPHGAFDLAPAVRRVFEYPYRPLFGLLNWRIETGRLAPRALTIFRPLERIHRAMAQDMRARGYDLVLVHTDAMTQSPYLVRWLDGLPSVYYCQEVLRVAHEPTVAQYERTRTGRSWLMHRLKVADDGWVLPRLAAADRENVAAATLLLVNSQHSRERVLAAYGRHATVCYLGVDVQRFRPLQVQRSAEVLSIGSPLPRKGHGAVIEALALIPADRRPALRVVGLNRWGGDQLERRAQALGVSMTIEIGIDETALVERYNRALATICAARLEPFGFTPLESMACGTPVVAIREGGYRETVVDGVTGLLVEPDPSAIAAAILEITRNPALASQLGERGRERVRQCWTWEQAGQRLEAILESARRTA